MEYEKDFVRCHAYIEFAAPATSFLSTSESCNRVMCISCLFAVPVSSVSDNAYFALAFLCHGGNRHHAESYKCNNQGMN
jgi:hypothetical protein